jgi:hypothetical protein
MIGPHPCGELWVNDTELASRVTDRRCGWTGLSRSLPRQGRAVQTRHKPLAAIPSIPIGVILRAVWNDLGEIAFRLRRQSIIALSIVVVLDIVDSASGISSNPVLSEVSGLVSAVAVLPFEIAIFRLLILDEATTGYHFAISTVRFQRMLGWTVAFWAIGNILTYLPGAITSSEAAMAIIAPFAVIFTGIVFLMRVAILLPAIAVDAPGASIGNAFADTRGYAWLIVKAFVTALLPSILIFIMAGVLAWLVAGSRALSDSGSGAAVAETAIFSALRFLVAISVTIFQARLFMRIGDRVKRGAESAGD